MTPEPTLPYKEIADRFNTIGVSALFAVNEPEALEAFLEGGEVMAVHNRADGTQDIFVYPPDYYAASYFKQLILCKPE